MYTAWQRSVWCGGLFFDDGLRKLGKIFSKSRCRYSLIRDRHLLGARVDSDRAWLTEWPLARVTGGCRCDLEERECFEIRISTGRFKLLVSNGDALLKTKFGCAISDRVLLENDCRVFAKPIFFSCD